MQAVSNVIKMRVVPAAVELIDGDSLEAVATYLNARSLAPEGTGALLLLEVDGLAEAVTEEATRCERRQEVLDRGARAQAHGHPGHDQLGRSLAGEALFVVGSHRGTVSG